jgi:hypothetical protein
MVFCRGCGKEIHETAMACPLCGAPQAVPPALASKRNAALLVLWAILWFLVFWFGSLFLAGAVAGAFNPQDASHAGQRAGEVLGGPFLLLSLCASIVLTIYGKLPGTRKPAQGA